MTQNLLIRNINIISLQDSNILKGYNLLIRDGRIEKIFHGQPAFTIPDNTKTFDGDEKFICPGLIDMHVHLFDSTELLTYLSYGITTVLNMSGSPEHLLWRNRSQKNDFIGSRMFTVSRTLDGYPSLNWMFWAVETPEQAKKAILYHKKEGYDMIKIYGTLNPDIFDEIQLTASKAKLAVIGHVPRQVGVEDAIKKNYKLIAHGDDLLASYFNSPPDNSAIDSLAKSFVNTGIIITPNLCIQQRMLDEITDLTKVLHAPENRSVSPAVYSEWIKSNNRNLDQYNLEEYKSYLNQVRNSNIYLTAALKKYGIKMVLGTDAAVLGFEGESAYQEITALHSAGLSNYEALFTITNGARFLDEHLAQGFKGGIIKEGYVADLIILDKNPLEDINNIRSISSIISKGKLYSRQYLLDSLEKRFIHYPVIKAKVDLIDSLFDNGKIADAIHVLNETIVQYPTDKIYAEWVLGIKALRIMNSNPQGAINIQKENVLLNPSDFSVYNELANGFFQNKMYDSSLKYLHIALKLAPGNAFSVRLRDKTVACRQTFDPVLKGSYEIVRLDKKNNILDTVYVTVQSNTKEYNITYTKGEKKNIQTQPTGKTNTVWFNVGGDYGENEYSIQKIKTGFMGRWTGMFGNNGNLKMRRISP